MTTGGCRLKDTHIDLYLLIDSDNWAFVFITISSLLEQFTLGAFRIVLEVKFDSFIFCISTKSIIDFNDCV